MPDCRVGELSTKGLIHRMPDYRVGELEQARSVEVDRFQHLLREEGERRETAERALEKLKGEVSIGMEDFSPSSSPEGEESENRNMGM